MNDRPSASHVREDGSAKISYETRMEAAEVADNLWARTKRAYAPYLCAQKPDHWHVGQGMSNLEVR